MEQREASLILEMDSGQYDVSLKKTPKDTSLNESREKNAKFTELSNFS